MKKGIFVLIIGPPGVGKTTIVEALLQRNPHMTMLTTTTTRKPRKKNGGGMEQDGEEYYFTTREEFQRLIDSGDFLEWMENYGNLYGSSKSRLEEQLEKHPIVLCVMDVKGALQVKRERPETLAIFVVPLDEEDCARRLHERHGTDPEDLKRRIDNISVELSHKDDFDWTVVNRDGQLFFVLEAIERILKDVQKEKAPQ